MKPPEIQAELQLGIDELGRVVNRTRTLSDLITTAIDANLTQVSLQQNEDMRKISAWVAIAAIPTMIAGIYGMNFKEFPELELDFGYPTILLVMLGACGLLYRAFRRSGWLWTATRAPRRMTATDIDMLDNAVRYSLVGAHREFAERAGLAARYDPDVSVSEPSATTPTSAGATSRRWWAPTASRCCSVPRSPSSPRVGPLHGGRGHQMVLRELATVDVPEGSGPRSRRRR